MEKEKQRKIMEQAIQIQELVKANQDKKIENIQYYEELEFVGSGLEERQVYVVKLQGDQQENQTVKEKNIQEKGQHEEEMQPYMPKEAGQGEVTYAIYKNQELIATVSKDGKLEFTTEYKRKLKEVSPEIYESLNLEGNDFILPEELAENDMILTDNDLEKFEEEQGKNKETQSKKQDKGNDNEKNGEKEEKDLSAETQVQRKEKIASTLEIRPEDVRGFAQIDPNRKISEDSALRDIMPETKNYERIEIACVKGEKKQGDGRFCILGIEKDGTRKVLNSVQSIEGVSTKKQVISINDDGDEIKENSVQGLMRINSKEREDGIAFSLGSYGMLDISYVRDVMNKETRRSTPIDTLELENRKNLSPEVRENAADDIGEVRKEGENFRKNEEQGKKTQDLEDIDKQRNENIETTKSRIAEEAAEIVNEGATKGQVRNFISKELDNTPNLTLNEQEKANLTNQIEEEAIDLSRFPSITRRPQA